MNKEEKVETFDDARRMMQEKMAETPETVEAAEQEGGEQMRGEDAQPAEPETASQPVEQSPPPDQQAMQMMAEMQQIQAQNQQLQAQNQQLQRMLQEISQKNQNEVVEETLTPPVLDISELWMEDENVIQQKQQEYAQQMADYTKKQLLSELAPFLETAKQGMAERERQEALNGLSMVPELDGIMGMTPTLERIIQSNPALANSDAPIEDKLITAFAIAKGAEAIKNGQQQPGIDDFVQMYAQNPDLQKRIEQIRARNAAENAAEVPPMSASAGAFNAALRAPEKPKDFDEARKLAFARLGL